MKTKLFVAAMASLLVFASCVKDIESASVTNVRNAKAAELTSIAAYNNALAEAATITANAEAALKAAQAEYQKAQAELVKAQAELVKVQTEEERTRIELLIVQLETAKAESAAELKRIAQQMELDLENHKLALFKAQQAYIDYAQQLEEAERQRLIAVSAEYTIACQKLIDLQVEKINKEAEIAQIEAGIKTVEDALPGIAEEITAELKYIDAQIENYKKYLQADSEELLAAYNDAYFKVDQLSIAEADARTAYNKAMAKNNEAWNKVYGSEYNTKFYDVVNDVYNFISFDKIARLENGVGYIKEDGSVAPLFAYSQTTHENIVYKTSPLSVVKEYTPNTVFSEGFTAYKDDKIAAENTKHEASLENMEAQKAAAAATLELYAKRMDAAYPESKQQEIAKAYEELSAKIKVAREENNKAIEVYNIARGTHDFTTRVDIVNAERAYSEAWEKWNACNNILNSKPGEIAIAKSEIYNCKQNIASNQSYLNDYLKPELNKKESELAENSAKLNDVITVIAGFKLDELQAKKDEAYLEYLAHSWSETESQKYWDAYDKACQNYNDVFYGEAYNKAIVEKDFFTQKVEENTYEVNNLKNNIERTESYIKGETDRLEEITKELEKNEAELAQAQSEIDGLKAKMDETFEAYQTALGDEYKELYELLDAYYEANSNYWNLVDERNAIANVWGISVRTMTDCWLDEGTVRYPNVSTSYEYVEILLPGSWNYDACDSYIQALNNRNECQLTIDIMDKGVELENAKHEEVLAGISEEFAVVKECEALKESHLADIENAKAVQEELVTVWKAFVDAEEAVNAAYAEYVAIIGIMNHDEPIQETIDKLLADEEALVGQFNTLIEMLEAKSLDVSILKAKLPILEAQIAAQEKLVEKLEAELNALLGE